MCGSGGALMSLFIKNTKTDYICSSAGKILFNSYFK